MNDLSTSRRDFLKASGATAGVALLGFALPLKGRDAFAAAAGAAPAQVNAWVKIAPDGVVTLVVPKSEMGQGVYTGYAQVLADELDADWRNVRVESAPVDSTFNVPGMGMQFTGGSTSVMAGFEGLRNAGAAARAMLVAAAAEQLKVPAASLKTANGAVVDPASGRKLSYGALAASAAKQTPPAKPTPKPRSEWRYIGKSMPRVDSREKVNGTGGFGLDVRVPNLHYAVLARPPSFGAKLKTFDADGAKAVRGVVDVVPVSNGIAVVATNTWAARQGRDRLTAEWDESVSKGFSTTALAKQWAELAAMPGVTAFSKGSPEDVLANSKHLVEADYSAPYLAHAPMEPLNCTVVIANGECDVYTGTQMQTVERGVAARVTGLPPDKIRIHTTLLGGGFGRRANPHSDFVVEALEVAKATGKPVMTVWTREDDVRGGFYRPFAHTRVVAALGDDGRPQALTYTAVCQSIMKGTFFEAFGLNKKTGLDGSTHEGASDTRYADGIPNLRVDVHQETTPVPVLWWRSVGNLHTAFAMESFIDECAHAAKQDPLAYRLSLLKDERMIAALKLAADKAGWGKPLPKGRARGIAVHESFGSVVAEVAEVSLVGGRPRVHRVVAAFHCGTAVNPALIAHQVESAVTYGLSAALQGEITIEGGRVQQSNFNDYPMLRIDDTPVVEAYVVPSDGPPTGVGEPATPVVAPAVANALFALTGVRVRRLPFKHTDFTKKA